MEACARLPDQDACWSVRFSVESLHHEDFCFIVARVDAATDLVVDRGELVQFCAGTDSTC